MSNHHRKRKHRGPHSPSSSRPNHYRNDDNTTQAKFPAFLSHHDAYQASLAPFPSSSNLDEFETDKLQDRERHDPLQALYIQAYEADIIRGPDTRSAAESLEVVEYVGLDRTSNSVNVKLVPKIGSALIQLQLNGSSSGHSSTSERGDFGSGNGSMRVFDEDDERLSVGQSPPAIPQKSPQFRSNNLIWVDRYDARLLLDALPTPLSAAHAHAPTPSSPTGWSDLSSDAEDTFFFDPEETEDFRKEKRRRLMEKTREERLRARREEDGDEMDEESKKEEEEVWGGSDEEPDQPQKDLMSRTAIHLLSSPNPAQLEMRILANHGRDKRFAFLRGRWSKTWGLVKAKTRLELAKAKEDQEKQKTEKKAGLGLLASYGSDSEVEHEDDHEEIETNKEETTGKENAGLAIPDGKEVTKVPDNEVQVNDNELAKEARRKRLKAWSEQRKASREKGESAG